MSVISFVCFSFLTVLLQGWQILRERRGRSIHPILKLSVSRVYGRVKGKPVKGIFILLLILPSLTCFPQTQDTVNVVRSSGCGLMRVKKTIAIPALLITAGVLGTTNNDIIDRIEVREERNEYMAGFRTHADDYLQFAPIVAVYGLNALGVKGKNDFANRTALLIKSELFVTAMVFPLKTFTSVPRPDSGAPTSFPSGHTAQAFAAATFLHKEYGREHPLYSVLAYSTATGIGLLRVMNNRHWASDVLAGAGIGILATNLAYLTHQYKWRRPRPRREVFTFSPAFSQRSYGVYLAINIR